MGSHDGVFVSLGVTVKQIVCHWNCDQTNLHLALLDSGVSRCSADLGPTLGSIDLQKPALVL